MLHAISMIAAVLRRERQAADELRRLRDRIYDLNCYKAFLLEYHDIDLRSASVSTLETSRSHCRWHL